MRVNASDNGNSSLHSIQANGNSIVGFLNGMAYAILGIPSVIYGYLLMKEAKKFSGLFLISNGIACFIGIIGYMTDCPVLSFGTMLGGVLFVVSLIFMFIEFKSRKEELKV